MLMTCLIATGCSTVPLPKYAKRGDFVTIPLGGSKTVGNSNYLTRQDVTVTVTDDQGQVFPAIVNRLFTELTNAAFYEPVDDIGPDRSAVHEDTRWLCKRRRLFEGGCGRR